MRRFLHDAWWRLATLHQPTSPPDLVACGVLSGAAAVFRGAVAIRNAAYDQGRAWVVRLPCPVVSVGNLTVGGTGKTACVELLAGKLAGAGQRLAILSRGYGGSAATYWVESRQGQLTVQGASGSGVATVADEPQLLARHLEGIPVVVGRRRDQTGRLALERWRPDALVLDDGFQHRRLHRDCDIVLLDARTPFEGHALLPRGPMREPLAALRRAHVVIITKADEARERLAALCEQVSRLAPHADVLTAVHEPVKLLDGRGGSPPAPSSLQGRRVGLVSSIGDPAGFEATVRRDDAAVVWHAAFPDHHRYDGNDWRAVCARASREPVDALVTTEKDWVRLQSVVAEGPAGPRVWVLAVRLRLLTGEDLLDARLNRLCTG